MVPPAAQNVTPKHAVTVRPRPTVPNAIGRRRANSPAPTARLTRMPTAIESPSGNMNANDTHVSAIWCAASGTAPSHPIITPEKANAVVSNSSIPDAGSPSLSISRKRAREYFPNHPAAGQAARTAGSRRSQP